LERYRNPILPGFYPDPSLCRVGDDFYLATSSFEFFPGVPIFHSRDLVHWRQIGHCLTRESQLPLNGAIASEGIWAPTLRWQQGRFYMITTVMNSGAGVFRHFMVSAQDPAGPWSEPIVIPHPSGIDPSLLFDDDGKVYFSSNSDGIVLGEIDVKTGKFLVEPKPVWRGSGGHSAEGAHLYKIRGTYYLLAAEGGTHTGHRVTIARSAKPYGPYESCPRNPILSHRDRNIDIKGLGHADIIEDGRGRWWMVCLGFRHVGGRWTCSQTHHLGRETFLAPLEWDAQGWPVVNKTGTLDTEMEADLLPAHPWDPSPARDDFDKADLGLQWNFLRNPEPGSWSLSERPGWLRLRANTQDLDSGANPAFVGRRQCHFDMQATALLDFEPAAGADEAGLTVFANEQYHYDLYIGSKGGYKTAFLRKRVGDITQIVAALAVASGPVELQIKANADQYTFIVSSPPGAGDRTLGRALTRLVSTEVAMGFTGVYLAMFACGLGKAVADFDWFEYVGKD
jgi:alpha-N-arabinofuranosidase